jgi:hypothetical protein
LNQYHRPGASSQNCRLGLFDKIQCGGVASYLVNEQTFRRCGRLPFLT